MYPVWAYFLRGLLFADEAGSKGSKLCCNVTFKQVSIAAAVEVEMPEHNVKGSVGEVVLFFQVWFGNEVL